MSAENESNIVTPPEHAQQAAADRERDELIGRLAQQWLESMRQCGKLRIMIAAEREARQEVAEKLVERLLTLHGLESLKEIEKLDEQSMFVAVPSRTPHHCYLVTLFFDGNIDIQHVPQLQATIE